MPPLALPKREYMENAKALWERLGLPALRPEMPWFGYSLGDWNETWDHNAGEAAQSIDKRDRKKFGLGEDDALRFAGCEGDHVAQRDWRSFDSPDHGGGFCGVFLKGRGEIDHFQWEILCKVMAGKSISGRSGAAPRV